MPTKFVHDGFDYHYDLNTMYGTNKVKLVVWDAYENLIGDVTIDHNIDHLDVQMGPDSHCELCSGNYYSFELNDGTYDYLNLAKYIVTIDS